MKRKIGWIAATLIGLCLVSELVSRSLDDPSSPDFIFSALHLDTRVSDWMSSRRGGFEGENGWISINPQGWRGTAPFIATRTPSVRRIAVAGTGNVFGENLADDQTWPEHLEEVLGTRTRQPVEVWNFGRPGATMVYLDRVLLDEILAGSPDVVVLAFGGFNEALLADVPESQTLDPAANLRNAMRGLSSFRRLERSLWRRQRGDGPRQAKVSVAEFTVLLDRALARIEGSGAQALLVQEVVIHPDIADLWTLSDLAAYRGAVRTLAAARGVAIFDPALVLPETELAPYFWHDLLYGPEAAERIGQGVADIIDTR